MGTPRAHLSALMGTSRPGTAIAPDQTVISSLRIRSARQPSPSQSPLTPLNCEKPEIGTLVHLGQAFGANDALISITWGEGHAHRSGGKGSGVRPAYLWHPSCQTTPDRWSGPQHAGAHHVAEHRWRLACVVVRYAPRLRSSSAQAQRRPEHGAGTAMTTGAGTANQPPRQPDVVSKSCPAISEAYGCHRRSG